MEAGCGQAEAAPRGSTTTIVRGNRSQALKGCIHAAGEAAETSIIPASSMHNNRTRARLHLTWSRLMVNVSLSCLLAYSCQFSLCSFLSLFTLSCLVLRLISSQQLGTQTSIRYSLCQCIFRPTAIQTRPPPKHRLNGETGPHFGPSSSSSTPC